MKRFATLILVLLAVVACVVGLYVSAANRDVIVLDLLFWPAVTVRSGLLVVLAFVAGGLVGVLFAGLAAAARQRHQKWRVARNGSGSV